LFVKAKAMLLSWKKKKFILYLPYRWYYWKR